MRFILYAFGRWPQKCCTYFAYAICIALNYVIKYDSLGAKNNKLIVNEFHIARIRIALAPHEENEKIIRLVTESKATTTPMKTNKNERNATQNIYKNRSHHHCKYSRFFYTSYFIVWLSDACVHFFLFLSFSFVHKFYTFFKLACIGSNTHCNHLNLLPTALSNIYLPFFGIIDAKTCLGIALQMQNLHTKNKAKPA